MCALLRLCLVPLALLFTRRLASPQLLRHDLATSYNLVETCCRVVSRPGTCRLLARLWASSNDETISLTTRVARLGFMETR